MSSPADVITLSICIPTYNRARYLDQLLKTLVDDIPALEFSYEIVIGDNGSTDHTPEVVARHTGALNIRAYRNPRNIGPYENQRKIYQSAHGKYCLYLADDDLLLMEQINENIRTLENNPGVSAIYAPWVMYDRVRDETSSAFYQLDQDYLIQQNDHAAMMALLLTRHIFPEIYIARRECFPLLYFAYNDYAYWAFVHSAEILSRGAILFSATPYYRVVTQYFDDHVRVQAGTEEVKVSWDRYRGGLEYLFNKFNSSLTPEQKTQWFDAINQFIRIRMNVALRIRTFENTSPIDNYYVANRLRGLGDGQDLPVHYDFYRVNAALEYLNALDPFVNGATRFAYFRSRPLRILPLAQKFGELEFTALEDGQLPTEPTVIVTPHGDEPGRPVSNCHDHLVFTSELDLISMFP
ncbi:glycosyltransferase family 2 protein [Ralstonia soli]|uniref:Glycosyltransferase family 2 protein n=1 Tax=Ralstonia soli TaxID=2953896 RepID=A0ABT1APA1_9RALS|nr:glycosyltransferase family 2 protein [Ralstonia soli]MCO5400267.1 glycosyltransferase family 2 protein [Ralstonia soli]